MIRKAFFWSHLVVGLTTGIIVLILCVTGGLLVFEKQIVNWAERDVRAVPPADGAERIAPAVLITNALKSNPGKITNMEWFADPRMPVRLYFADRSVVLLSSWTGEVLGHGATTWRGFFRTMTTLHTNLLTNLTGKGFVDVANACFVFLILSGLWIWWPRQWRWKVLRSYITIRLDAKGKARDWNWHNALGFWFLLPLLIIAATGLVLSFKPVDQWWREFAAEHFIATAQPLKPMTTSAADDKPTPGWEGVMNAVQQQFAGWRSIMTFNSGKAQDDVALMVHLGTFGERSKIHKVVVRQSTNTIIKISAWENDDASTRARAIARFGHTGEILGKWGQTFALLACFAGLLLVYTGFALSWRRFFGAKGGMMADDAFARMTS